MSLDEPEAIEQRVNAAMRTTSVASDGEPSTRLHTASEFLDNLAADGLVVTTAEQARAIARRLAQADDDERVAWEMKNAYDSIAHDAERMRLLADRLAEALRDYLGEGKEGGYGDFKDAAHAALAAYEEATDD